jgi:hypothetical protein
MTEPGSTSHTTSSEPATSDSPAGNTTEDTTTDQPQHPLVEIINGGTPEAYTREWYCIPPNDGVKFHVVRSTWSPDQTVQKIYEIKIGDVW